MFEIMPINSLLMNHFQESNISRKSLKLCVSSEYVDQCHLIIINFRLLIQQLFSVLVILKSFQLGYCGFCKHKIEHRRKKAILPWLGVRLFLLLGELIFMPFGTFRFLQYVDKGLFVYCFFLLSGELILALCLCYLGIMDFASTRMITDGRQFLFPASLYLF